MASTQIEDQIKQLALLSSAGMYLDDFLLTWDRSDDEIASVFDRYREPLYKEASFKPYTIAAMIFLARFSNPEKKLLQLLRRDRKRII